MNDFGTWSTESVDYLTYVKAAAKVLAKEVFRLVLSLVISK